MVVQSKEKDVGQNKAKLAQNQQPSYYDGSVEAQVCSSLVVQRLETRRRLTRTAPRLVVVMVGLPGRGKSFLGRKLQGFLTWRGNICKAFNVGKYRREANREVTSTPTKPGLKATSYSGSGSSSDEDVQKTSIRELAGSCDANFFDTNNAEAVRIREEVAMIALQDMLSWLDGEQDDNTKREGHEKRGVTDPVLEEDGPPNSIDDRHDPSRRSTKVIRNNNKKQNAPPVFLGCSPPDNSSPFISEEYEMPLKGHDDDDEEEDTSRSGRKQGASSNPRNATATKSEKSKSSKSKRKSRHHRNKEADHSRIAIFDATNSTHDRRRMILETCKMHQIEKGGPDIGIVFLESICDDEELLEENYRYKVRNSPDFEGMSEEEAMADLRTRARKYEERYETVDDDTLSYIKLFNFSSKILANNIYGRAAKIILPALMSWHVGDRPVYLCRAGKTFSDEDFFGIGGMIEATSQISFGTEYGTVTSGLVMNELDVSTRNGGNPSTVLDISQGKGRGANGGATKKYVQLDTSTHRAQVQLDASSHVSKESGGANTTTRDRTKTTRGTHLDEAGNRFRDALSAFINEEGKRFITRHSHALRNLNTGTSITGSATNMTGLTMEDFDMVRSSLRLSRTLSSGSCSSFGSAGGNESEGGADFVPYPTFPCCVMSSTMPRAIQTATWKELPFHIRHLSNLNPLDKGDFNGMEIDDLMDYEPEWYSKLTSDPFNTRFPGGECYRDVRDRLESVLIDIEQQVAPVVVVSHVSVLQVLLAYFRQTPPEECTQIEVPMNTVIELNPLRGGGWKEIHHKLIEDEDDNPEASNVMDEDLVKLPIWTDTRRTPSFALKDSFNTN